MGILKKIKINLHTLVFIARCSSIPIIVFSHIVFSLPTARLQKLGLEFTGCSHLQLPSCWPIAAVHVLFGRLRPQNCPYFPFFVVKLAVR
jgi:hypothetical protein